MGLSPGFLLGDYEILAPIGVGGMGEVYRARDRRLDREVAIKVLRDLASSDSENLRRFEQEARAAASLNHPNILAVYQLGQFEGVPYLVSELLEGETLRAKISRGPLPFRQVIDVGGQIARGLSAAHRKGIIHRDLKPENLFLTSDGHVRILDFGLARLVAPGHSATQLTQSLQAGTSPGVVLGTVGYMSPEQVRGEPVDARSDIFSFSIILREMLTGEPTFRKATAAETMTAILNEDPPPVASSVPGAPGGLQRVLDRGLEKNPDQRFHSAADLAFALETMSDPEMRKVKSRTGKSDPQLPWGATTWLPGTLAGLLVVGLVTWFWLRAGAPPRVSNYQQITNDGEQKNLLGTDGARVYIAKFGTARQALTAIQINGGARSDIVLPSPNMGAVNMSADGTEFLVIDGGGVPVRGSLWSLPVLGGSPRRLGTANGNCAAWSRDQQWLAWCDATDLYVARGDGSSPRRIVTLNSLISNPVWSPDDCCIRFETSQGLGPGVGQHMLWEVNVDGSNRRRLLQGWHNPPDECCGSWSPGGKYFLFSSRGQIWALRRAGWLHRHPQPVQLTSSPMALSAPTPSLDGRKLFVIGATYRGELMRFDAGSRNFLPFLNGISAEYSSFSKDGRMVAWVSYPEGTLWRSKLDGSERVQLTFPPLQVVLPRWSPDGSKLVFFDVPDSPGRSARIYQVPSQGGTVAELIPEDRGNQQDPNWSPDGRKIVFARGASDATLVTGVPQIHLFDTVTHSLEAVPGSAGLFSPRWSPDGKSLAALTADSRKLLLFDFATQRWTTLTQGTFGWLNWSQDGRSLYLLDFSGNGGVLRVRLADGKVDPVADLTGFPVTGGFGGSMSLAPDDSPLLLRDRGTQDLYVTDLGNS